MKISRSIPFFALVFCASVTGSVASAQLSKLTAVPLLPGLARIVERGTLVVAQVNRNVPPVFVEGKDGKLAGFDIDLARAMAQRLRVKLEFRRTAKDFDEVVSQVATGEADLGISFLSSTARRARYVLFSQPYVKQNLSVLINRVRGLEFRRSCPSVKELARVAGISGMLGLTMGTENSARLRELNPDARPSEFANGKDLMAAVLAGKVAISLQGEMTAHRFLSKNPAARIRLRLCEIGRFKDHIAIAVPPDRYDVLNWVNVFLREHEIDLDASELLAHEGPWQF